MPHRSDVSRLTGLAHTFAPPRGRSVGPLAQINAANVGQLTLRCAFMLPELASFQTGPLVVDGTMYFTTFEGSYAIDASTCTQKWSRHATSAGPPGLAVNRGFAYLDGRLYRGTADAHVVALDPADGHVLWDRALPVEGPGISIAMAPIAANGRVYVGNAGGDTVGVTGHVYALDARDGHLIWRFDGVGALEQGSGQHVDQSTTADLGAVRGLDLLHAR